MRNKKQPINKKILKPKKKVLMKKADTVFSHYIRTKYQRSDGTVKCYTCGKIMDYKLSQCGHYESRSNHNLRFDINNARVQCSGCNVFLRGNYKIYLRKLEQELGKEKLEKLESMPKTFQTYYLDIFEGTWTPYLDLVIEYYEKKLQELKK